jgi:hypothetical protein
MTIKIAISKYGYIQAAPCSTVHTFVGKRTEVGIYEALHVLSSGLVLYKVLFGM